MTARKWLLTLSAGITAIAVALFCGNRCSGSDEPEPSWEEFPVRGIDISSHNGEVDFEAVRQQGYRFVLIKASEGSAFKDPRFYSNIAKARKAGLKVGAYHFFRFDATGYMQALNFLHSLRGQELDMPAVLDIEQWTNPTNRPTPRVIATLNALIRKLEKENIPVMLYTNKDGYEEFVSGRLIDYPLWICSFTRPKADVKWDIWQYTHRGTVEGVSGRVDIDIFNGSPQEWEHWCETHSSIMQ